MQQHEPDLTARTRILTRTGQSPGISFITAGQTDPAPYRAALTEALAALPRADRDTLRLRAIVPLPEAAYRDLPHPPRPIAAAQG